MFKKEFNDRKKLKAAIITRFQLSDEDGELLVPEGLLSAKFTSSSDVHGITYFDTSGVPLWFNTGSNPTDYDALIPTVYTIWKRVFLPIIITPQLVVDKLRGGADLMAPGVINISPSHCQALPLPQDVLVCVSAYSRHSVLSPMAIGRMTMSSELVERSDKGKAVITLHTYGDMLWEKGGKLEPPKEPTILRPEGQAPILEAPEPTEGDVINDGAVDQNVEQQQASEELGADIVAGSQQPVQAYGESTGPEHSASDIDIILRNALLYFILVEGNNLSFPYSASALYADGILSFRPADANLSTAVIKNSTFKKLKPFLKSVEKDGILRLKEMGGDLNVMAVDVKHPAVTGFKKYRTAADDERRKQNAKEKEAKVEADNSMGVTEYYKPQGTVKALFEAVRLDPSAYYTAPTLRDDVLSAYISSKSLIHPVERGFFVLDDLLKSILLNKRESEEFMKRDEGLKRLIGACQPWHQVEQEGRRPEMRKGKLSPISIIIKKRQGNKAVTLITGYEPFFFAAETLGEDLRKLCAAQTSVSPVLGKANQLEVLVQGKQGKLVTEYLIGNGVPKRWIELEDTTEKKGK